MEPDSVSRTWTSSSLRHTVCPQAAKTDLLPMVTPGPPSTLLKNPQNLKMAETLAVSRPVAGVSRPSAATPRESWCSTSSGIPRDALTGPTQNVLFPGMLLCSYVFRCWPSTSSSESRLPQVPGCAASVPAFEIP